MALCAAVVRKILANHSCKNYNIIILYYYTILLFLSSLSFSTGNLSHRYLLVLVISLLNLTLFSLLIIVFIVTTQGTLPFIGFLSAGQT